VLGSCGGPSENKSTKKLKRFTRVDPSVSGVTFRNQLTDSDDYNIIEYLYYYNGGGVAAGDINNDGLCDLYFSSNQGANKLYLNKGNLVFEEVTESSKTQGISGWKTGVCMADVNGDGWLDIFVAGVGGYKKFDGRNQLLINNQDLTFTDRTEEYGLLFQGFSTHASFLDYDLDGDLDMYLVNHSVHTSRSLGEKSDRFQHDAAAGDRLYRNELIPSGKASFTDVTLAAGILNSKIAYGLSVSVSDLNNDLYPDIYIANDFHENDYMYLNNRNGTFSQVIETAMKHTSRFSMGSSAADLNEDGWNDIITLDMRPRDEEIIKTTQQDDNYDIFQYKLRFGYHYQYARNALQVSNGVDADGNVIFTDVAPYAGIDATDWSWAPVVADFDNDGWKDLFVTNGILQRPNSLDYINYISSDSAQRFLSDEKLASQMPGGKVPDIMFRNTSDMKFKEVTNEWMDATPDISNGAVSADLDNDGDLEIVINSLNDDAVIWQNNSAIDSAHYLRIKLDGDGANKFGLGAKVIVTAGGRSIYLEQQPVRGWESSSEPVLHAGLGKTTSVDSVTVIWPTGAYEVQKNVKSDQVISFRQPDASGKWKMGIAPKKFLTTTDLVGFKHNEDTFNPFEQQPLLTHGFSTQGPCVAVADFNGDKRDDYFIGGAAEQESVLYMQTASGNFTVSRQPVFAEDITSEDTAVAAIDVNGDGFMDLVVGGGGQQHMDDSRLMPRVYINNGKGQFRRLKDAMPAIFLNTSTIAAADIDDDGDQDLFIGGLVVSTMYGADVRSNLLVNDGKGKFSDVSSNWMAESFPGMISDAIWTDVNGDSRPDLVLAGEWISIKILINNAGQTLVDRTADYGLSATEGMWSSLAAADFDKDGDIDIVAGNMGLNSRLTASESQPLELYAGDIDSNFSLDHIITYYNQGVKYPFISRDLLVKQVPPLKRKFLRYADFGKVTLEDIIPGPKQALHKKATMLSSVYLENVDKQKFVVHQLPKEAQYSIIQSILPTDVNRDGNEDMLLVGNLDSVLPDIGRFDGSYGLMLLGDGRGNFSAQPISSGFVVKGQGRDIKAIANPKGEKIYLVARNNDSVLYFK
jgi:hypothetical protein